MTILVTGSAGHLGEGLVRLLGDAGRAVRGLDIKPSPFTQAVGSITDPHFVREAMHGVSAVIHAATLHKPHLATHDAAQFIATNVLGTQRLLDAARDAGAESFVLTSTTSSYGAVLSPPQGSPAVWIDETVQPAAKNLYGATKLAAEHLAEVAARQHGLPVVVLRVSRFFPEDDDNRERREAFSSENLQAIELLHRRADLADMAGAHLAALERAPQLGFARFVVSAPSPFSRDDLALLNRDAAAVVARHFPQAPALFAARGWRLPERIDRVYDSSAARASLGWRVERDFVHVLDCLADGRDFRSPLALAVGRKGYHDRAFAEGPYPV